MTKCIFLILMYCSSLYSLCNSCSFLEYILLCYLQTIEQLTKKSISLILTIFMQFVKTSKLSLNYSFLWSVSGKCNVLVFLKIPWNLI